MNFKKKMYATKANLPSQLPFLPGNSYADPTITRYHKTQLLGVRDGAMLGKSRQKFKEERFMVL